MATTSGFARHLAPGYRDIVGTTFKSWEAFYSKLLKVEATTRNYEDYFHASTMPIAVSKSENAPIKFYDPYEGSQIRVTPGGYAIGLQVSREVWDDDLYKSKSALRRSASELGRSYIELVEVTAHDVFNSGFTTYGTVDGSTALFDTSHPRLDGGTAQANEPTTAIALSTSAYRAGRNAMLKVVDDTGKRIRSMPKIILTGIDLGDRAEVILGTKQEPGGNNNDINTMYGEVSHIRSPYITSSTAFYLLGADHWLKFLWRTRPEMDSYDDKDTKSAKFTIWGRFAVLPIHWHDTWASPGA